VLIVKGRAVRLHMAEGGPMVRPRGAMMHDPKGTHWPKCSVLIGPFTAGKRAATPKEYAGTPREYLGRTYSPRVGSVDLPPKSLDAWQEIGEVKRIDYVRTGRKNPGGYQHTFNKPHGVSWFVFLFKGKGKAVLRRHGRFYRLDLSKNCQLDDRGFVFP
jgi:hypothetical protein